MFGVLKMTVLALAVFGFGALIGGYYIWDTGSGGIGPDSIFWVFDTAEEKIRLYFASDAAERVTLELAMMQERLDELSDLEKVQKLSKEMAAKIKAEYVALADQVISDIESRAKEAVDAKMAELAQEARNIVASQEQALEGVLTDASDQVKDPLQGIVKALQGVYTKVTAVVGESQN